MPKTILIVDDEPDLVKILTILFRAFGYETESAGDGQAALERVRAHRPDLVLMDVMMPVMTGLDACSAIKADPATAGVPVVLLSARSQWDDRELGRQAGADAFVPKPFENRALLARVRAMLGDAP